MKNKIKRLSGFLSLIGSLIFAISCNNLNIEDPKPEENEYGKFSKEIIVFDRSGLNSIVIEFFADDFSVLESYTQLNKFTLSPAVATTFISEYPHEGELSDSDIKELNQFTNTPKVVTTYKNLNLGKGYENGFKIDIEVDESDSRAPFRWTSDFIGPYGYKKFQANRHTGWHKVYLDSSFLDENGYIIDIDISTQIPNDSNGIIRYYSSVQYWTISFYTRSSSHYSYSWHIN